MKHLIIYAHPRQDSLNALLKTTIERHLLGSGEVQVRDLYQINFNPLLSAEDMQGWHQGLVSPDVQVEQDYIRWADNLIIIHPLWWTGLPAMLKGYIERVFSYGFAYRYDQGIQKGLLKGKQAFIVNTQGKSHEQYRQTGMDQALVKTSDLGVYQYCGLDVREHFFLEQADRSTAADIDRWRQQITARLDACYGDTAKRRVPALQ